MQNRKESASEPETLQDQLTRLKRAVSFDSYDMSVRQLVDMIETSLIDMAPEYQRHFIWDHERESELIESVLLGIPIPSIYMATNGDSTWEVVDGVQRISTLLHFVGTESLLEKIGKNAPLRIDGLLKLTTLNGSRFADLPQSLQFQFQTRSLRLTALNDKSDPIVRYDLFERLNTGGIELHAQEIRNCVFRGWFKELIKDLAHNKHFRTVYKSRNSKQMEADYEEAVLRFFAFYERYEAFDHLVVRFLNDYMVEKNKERASNELAKTFKKTMQFLAQEFPTGLRRSQSTTPAPLYEAIVVGCALAMRQEPSLPSGRIARIAAGDELKALTTVGTNTRRMVKERIELVKNGMLA